MSDSRLARQLAACLLLGSSLLASAAARGDERILDFDSTIVINKDASLVVTERIRVRSEGENIRRGIYREFPTRYEDRAGNRHRVGFQVLDVLRDGQPEDWHTERRSNGIRVYIGGANRLVPPGTHEYTLRYATHRQLGFFDSFDELYWNVTGSGWLFPIDQASARVELPSAVEWRKMQVDFYTGRQGESGKAAESRSISGRVVEFRTTRVLQPHEGLTIALGWPKGLVREPGLADRTGWFLSDNGGALTLIIGLLAPLAWYFWAWEHYGRDPTKGVIIPRFDPPKGLSAAGCRYVRDMAMRSDAFTAAVISLAIKGYLKIEENEDGFILYRQQTPGKRTASPGEQALLTTLLPEPTSWIELDNENHKIFQQARSALRQALKAEHHGRLFKLNTLYMVPALLMSVVAAAVAALLPAGFVVWLIFGALTLALHLVFLFLMRAPTPAGRRVMDEIEGFTLYLDTAEQDRLDRMKSPQMTPEVFEAFLPYAFALGVQNHWCERFAREFPREVEQGSAYSHAWYSGDRKGLSALHHLGGTFGKGFSSAIASASTPPGSSSGSGGGGFSGGGGGGGGGGGW